MVEIDRIYYDFTDDDEDRESIFGRIGCHVPVEEGKVFDSVDSALDFAARKLGYDIPARSWARTDSVDIIDDGKVFQEYIVDLTVDWRFRRVLPDSYTFFPATGDYYNMNILVTVKTV